LDLPFFIVHLLTKQTYRYAARSIAMPGKACSILSRHTATYCGAISIARQRRDRF
jgi:hypothetical protein